MKYYVVKQEYSKHTILYGRGNIIIHRNDYPSKISTMLSEHELDKNLKKYGYTRIQDAKRNGFYTQYYNSEFYPGYPNSAFCDISIIEMEA